MLIPLVNPCEIKIFSFVITSTAVLINFELLINFSPVINDHSRLEKKESNSLELYTQLTSHSNEFLHV